MGDAGDGVVHELHHLDARLPGGFVAGGCERSDARRGSPGRRSGPGQRRTGLECAGSAGHASPSRAARDRSARDTRHERAITVGSTLAPAAPQVHVVTDVLDVQVSLEGGELTRADLLAYPQVKGQPTPVRLLNRDSDESLFVLQSGLAGAAGKTMPTHLARYTAPATELRLAPGQAQLRLPLSWTDGQGVTVTKTYTFRRGQYAIGLDYQLQNASSAPWDFAPYAQLLRNNEPVVSSYFHPESYAYKGPAYDDGHKYEKLKMGKDPPTLDRQIDGGLARRHAASLCGRDRAPGRRALALPAHDQRQRVLAGRHRSATATCARQRARRCTKRCS